MAQTFVAQLASVNDLLSPGTLWAAGSYNRRGDFVFSPAERVQFNALVRAAQSSRYAIEGGRRRLTAPSEAGRKF